MSEAKKKSEARLDVVDGFEVVPKGVFCCVCVLWLLLVSDEGQRITKKNAFTLISFPLV